MNRSLTDIPPHAKEAIRALQRERTAHPAQGLITLQELEVACANEDLLQELLEEMKVSCVKYLKILCEFRIQTSNGPKAIHDGEMNAIARTRGITHDTTIESIQILSRTMKKHGRDGDWIKPLLNNRAAYGRFALLIGLEWIEHEHHE